MASCQLRGTPKPGASEPSAAATPDSMEGVSRKLEARSAGRQVKAIMDKDFPEVKLLTGSDGNPRQFGEYPKWPEPFPSAQVPPQRGGTFFFGRCNYM